MRRGFTVTELVFVIAIIGIVTTLAWGSVGRHIPRYRVVRAAKELRGDLTNLRNLSLSTNRQTRLRFTGSGGDCRDSETYGGSWVLEIGNHSRTSTAWDVLPADLEETGADTDQSEGVRDYGEGGARQSKVVCLHAWTEMKGPGTGNSDSVVFGPRGWSENPAEDFDSRGYLVFTFSNQDATSRGEQDEVSVTVTRAGLSRMESPNSSSDRPEVGARTASTTP